MTTTRVTSHQQLVAAFVTRLARDDTRLILRRKRLKMMHERCPHALSRFCMYVQDTQPCHGCLEAGFVREDNEISVSI